MITKVLYFFAQLQITDTYTQNNKVTNSKKSHSFIMDEINYIANIAI